MPKDVLFICVHNSARSQMAEAYLRQFGGNAFQVESAGFQPAEINPLVVEVMAEDGIDLSDKKAQSVFELFKAGRTFGYVITVCDESEGGQCPLFPGVTHRLHLPFPDPAALIGSREEKLAKLRGIRDAIKEKMHEFMTWEQSNHEHELSREWSSMDLQASQGT